MQSVSISRIKGQLSKAIAATLCLIFLFSVFTYGAQSGRKPPKRDEPSKPVQPPSDPEPSVEKTEPDNSQKSLIPMLILRGPSFNSTTYVDIVTDGCAVQLQKSSALKVNPSRTEVSRKDASDQAKTSEELYVLWLEADFDRLSSNNRNGSYSDVSVNYYLFTPKTGDRKSWGKIYLRPYSPTATRGGAPVPIPVPSNNVPIEYLLRQAGEDIADRVLGALNLRTRSIH